MEHIIDYFVRNYDFTTNQVGSNVKTLIKDDVHIFVYLESNKVIFNNIIFENIKTVKDLKFIYFNCKGLNIDTWGSSNQKLIVERNENNNNILKYE